MPDHWETLKREQILDCRIFQVDSVRRVHPSRQTESAFFVVDSPDWVNIIPVTQNNTVVFVRQYRHGSDGLTLEIPGGLVSQGEEPAQAAMRECREETGYASESEAELIGTNLPNPAFLNNTHYTYLWHGCAPAVEQQFDEHEDIEVVLVPLEQVETYIRRGQIRHSLVLTAFYFYSLYRARVPDKG